MPYSVYRNRGTTENKKGTYAHRIDIIDKTELPAAVNWKLRI